MSEYEKQNYPLKVNLGVLNFFLIRECAGDFFILRFSTISTTGASCRVDFDKRFFGYQIFGLICLS